MESLGALPFRPMGRLMKEYVQIPKEIQEDAKKLIHWVTRSIAFVSSLPPKQPKTKKEKS